MSMGSRRTLPLLKAFRGIRLLRKEPSLNLLIGEDQAIKNLAEVLIIHQD